MGIGKMAAAATIVLTAAGQPGCSIERENDGEVSAATPGDCECDKPFTLHVLSPEGGVAECREEVIGKFDGAFKVTGLCADTSGQVLSVDVDGAAEFYAFDDKTGQPVFLGYDLKPEDDKPATVASEYEVGKAGTVEVSVPPANASDMELSE